MFTQFHNRFIADFEAKSSILWPIILLPVRQKYSIGGNAPHDLAGKRQGSRRRGSMIYYAKG
jgi:hypothetical protein